MPRVARIVIPGYPHHVTQRGNNRQDVFFTDDDRRLYLSLLQEHAEAYGLGLLGYCLMTNHVHLIATPRDPHSLAKALGRTHHRYTQYINRLHGRSGHLWQNRFYSCALDELHLWRALAYVERNPVRAGWVRRAWTYAWSSAAAHTGKAAAPPWLDMGLWTQTWQPAGWEQILRDREDEAMLGRIRLNTHRGRPLATDRVLAKLEHLLGRRLRSLPVGRPKKRQDEPHRRRQISVRT